MHKDATVFCFALLVAIVVSSGCTSWVSMDAGSQPATRQIRAQDPIMGVWRYSSLPGIDARLRFNSDGTCVGSFTDGRGTVITPGTWTAQGNNAYIVHMTGVEGPTTWIFSPDKTGICPLKTPGVVLTPYHGDVAESAVTPPKVSRTGLPEKVMWQFS